MTETQKRILIVLYVITVLLGAGPIVLIPFALKGTTAVGSRADRDSDPAP